MCTTDFRNSTTEAISTRRFRAFRLTDSARLASCPQPWLGSAQPTDMTDALPDHLTNPPMASAKEVAALFRLDGPSRYGHMIRRVADFEEAWGLRSPSGWITLADDNSVKVWSLRALWLACARVTTGGLADVAAEGGAEGARGRVADALWPGAPAREARATSCSKASRAPEREAESLPG